MAADGKIVIETAIDTDGFTADTRKIEAAAKKAAEKLDDLGASVKQSIGKSATDASFNATEAVRKLSMQAQEAAKKRLEEFRQIDAVYRQQKEAAAELQRQLEEQAKTGVKTEEYIALEKELDKLYAAFDKLTEKQDRFIESGGNTKSQTFKGMDYDIDQLTKKIEALQARKTALESSGGAYTMSSAPTEPIADTDDIAATAAAEQQTQRFGDKVAALKDKLQQAVAGLKNYISNAKKTKKSSNIGAKGMAMLALGVSSLLGVLSKLRQGLADGLKNLAKFDKDTNAALSSMKSSLTQVKNSLATAFSPILTAIAPAINTLLGLISKALNAIGEFMAALTGQSTFTRATAVQENFSDSLNGTASAAKNAQKQMSGLDEMTTWQSKSSGGGGGGSAASKAFETVDITNSPIANFAKRIKDMIANQDFRGVGDAVAQKMNEAIGSWDGVGAGKRLSDGIKGALDTAIGFLQGTDWQNMGKQVSGFIVSIDWSGITSRLFEGLGSALGGLAGFLWGLISDAWASFRDWWFDVAFEDGKFTIEGLLNGIWEGIKGIGTWIYDHIFKPFVDGFCKAFGIHSPSTVMRDLGLNIVQGLLNAVKSIPQKVGAYFTALKTKVTTICSSITKWIGGAFKTDWSKKIGALGGDPLNALLKNIKNIWNSIKTTFNGIVTFIKGTFTGNWRQAWEGAKKAFSGVFSTLVSVAKSPINAIIGLVNGLITALNSMITGLNKIKVNIPSWIPGIGGNTIGFNIPQISKVPYLATGAVIPPNAPFTAVLGDQRHGTNLEAPESLIRQIVREEAGRGGSWTFTAQINRRTLFREIIEEAKLQQARTGKDPFALA